MKNLIIKSLFSTVLIAFASCNNLEVEPIGTLTGANFPKTDADAVALVNGAYVNVSQISTYTSYLTDLQTDKSIC